ncbi:MAG: AraC family transcriptional regulator [Leptospirales bacterium]
MITLAFTGLCHTLYLAGGQLLLEKRSPRNLLIAGLYFGIALVFLDVLVLTTAPPKWFVQAPALHFYFALPRFLLGPLAFLYFDFMLSAPANFTTARRDAGTEPRGVELWSPGRGHLVPGLTLLAAGTALLFVDFTNLAMGPDGCAFCGIVQAEITRRIPRTVLITVGNLHIAAYLLPGLLTALRLLLRGQSRPAALAVSMLGVGALAAAAFQGLSSLTDFSQIPDDPSMARDAGIVGISLLLIVLYTVGLLGQRYPRFLESLRLEARRIHRQRENRLRDLSPDHLQRSLDELMETEKIYRDEDLRLSTVASLLDVSPHQLSFYLNQVLRIDFATYVNRYRVGAAEEALRSPAKSACSVLEIGFEAGFNSKTAFYRAFGDATGLSPSKYRARHTNGGPPAPGDSR